MVEINKNKILCSIALTTITLAVAFAYEVSPRIAELETNKQYMSLLERELILTNREDSIASVAESKRASYDIENGDASRKEIIQLEASLFDLRSQKAKIIDSINIIEQEWVFSNLAHAQESEQPESEQPDPAQGEDDVAPYIYLSRYVKDNLAQVDYRNLVKAEELEPLLIEYSDKYLINYQNMLSLKHSYTQIQDEGEGEAIIKELGTIESENKIIAQKLSEGWDFVHDNKSFAYSMLLELSNGSNLLAQQQARVRTTNESIAKLQGGGVVDPTLEYLAQKSAMVEYEIAVSEQLSLDVATDSLRMVYAKLASNPIEYHPAIIIEERLFIEFEPIEFTSKSRYASINAIPKTEIYERGTIYRIVVGNFSTKQQPSIFRGAYPVSYVTDSNRRYTYYIGGYATLPEAEQAQIKMKERGFRRPEIVRWQDGKSRNLDEDPLTQSSGYRVIITGAASFSEAMRGEVGEYVNNISKVGNKFVIAPLYELSSAEMISSKLKGVDPTLDITIVPMEPTE